ncbi:MAG: GtrA family protein [Segetibacter sp.]
MIRTHKKRFAVFGLIGIINTAVDISIYLSLLHIHVPIIIANTISTSVALLLSYNLNKRFTYQDNQTNKTNFIRFLVVTLSGLWLLQPVVIQASLGILQSGAIEHSLGSFYAASQTYFNLFAKLAATAFTLVWNYVLYNKFVFGLLQKQSSNK